MEQNSLFRKVQAQSTVQRKSLYQGLSSSPSPSYLPLQDNHETESERGGGKSKGKKLSVAVGHDFLGQFGEDEGETNRPKKPKAVEGRQQLWKGREGVRTPPQERVSEWMDGGALVQRPRLTRRRLTCSPFFLGGSSSRGQLTCWLEGGGVVEEGEEVEEEREAAAAAVSTKAQGEKPGGGEGRLTGN